MQRIKVEFKNRHGQDLAGALELPDECPPNAMAIFVHCFTCGKDVVAASRISQALAAEGFGVLRFDFTGLGDSDGDFAHTSFSSNLEDVEAAADFLTEHYASPRLILGHSLGGSAALVAARRIDSIEAVATIAAPATPQHIQHLFAHRACDIHQEGRAEVNIGGRPFNLGSDLLDDLEQWPLERALARLHKPLLILHSPADTVVDVHQAALIYKAAHQPKSFIALDGADHLLTNAKDAEYVAQTVATWAGRYLDLECERPETPALNEGEVLVTEQDEAFLREILTHSHRLLADEPRAKGGSDQGPNPYDLLVASLGACTSMTLRMYANHKGLPIKNIRVQLRHQRIHAEDCDDCEHKTGTLDHIERIIHYEGALTEAQHERLLQIASKCPVHKALEGRIHITTSGGKPKG